MVVERLLGSSPKHPPRWRDVRGELHVVPHLRKRRRLGPCVNAHHVRDGMKFIQAASSSSCGNTLSAGSLRSPGITRLQRYYEPLRLPPEPRPGYLFPCRVDRRPTRRQSPERVSQVPDCSVGIRRPLSPRRARPLRMFVASRSMPGFAISGRLATLDWCNEAETGSLALRLTPLPSEASSHGIAPTLARSATW
jgi:hypothetical protein